MSGTFGSHLYLVGTRTVHCVQQKSSGLIFRSSRPGNDVRYSCHHNSSSFFFPHICAFVAFICLPFIKPTTPRIYLPKTPIHSLNLKLKHELKVMNFPRRVACYICFHGWMLRKGGCLPHPEVAERLNA